MQFEQNQECLQCFLKTWPPPRISLRKYLLETYGRSTKHLRIRVIHHDLKRTELKISEEKEKLQSLLSTVDFEKVHHICHQSAECMFQNTREQHLRKFDNLKKNTSQQQQGRFEINKKACWFINLSNSQLT